MAVDASLGAWAQARLTASWRGVPFRVRESQVKRGRRQVVHEYPFRDTVWVEDLGRATRVVSFRGFIVGDDVDGQLQQMDEAAEQAGDGTLVHPVLGPIQGASLVSYAASESYEQGRIFVLEFEFVLGSARSYPAATADTQASVAAAAAPASAAASASFGDEVATALGQGVAVVAAGVGVAAGVVAGVAATVEGYVVGAQAIVNSVRVIGAAATGLGGNYGRFSAGARLAAVPGVADVSAALAAASASAAAVAQIGAAAASLAALL